MAALRALESAQIEAELVDYATPDHRPLMRYGIWVHTTRLKEAESVVERFMNAGGTP
jgi:hypothetical protein